MSVNIRKCMNRFFHCFLIIFYLRLCIKIVCLPQLNHHDLLEIRQRLTIFYREQPSPPHRVLVFNFILIFFTQWDIVQSVYFGRPLWIQDGSQSKCFVQTDIFSLLYFCGMFEDLFPNFTQKYFVVITPFSTCCLNSFVPYTLRPFSMLVMCYLKVLESLVPYTIS